MSNGPKNDKRYEEIRYNLSPRFNFEGREVQSPGGEYNRPVNIWNQQDNYANQDASISFNSPKKFTNYAYSAPKHLADVQNIPSSVSQPNGLAKKPEFSKILKSSQFLTESGETGKDEKKAKSISASNPQDGGNQIDSSFNFLVDSFIQKKKNSGLKKSETLYEPIEEEERKTIGKSDSLTAMQMLNKKYNLGLESLDRLSEKKRPYDDGGYREGEGRGRDRYIGDKHRFDSVENEVRVFESQHKGGPIEVVHPKLRVNHGQASSNATEDKVDLRSISRNRVQKDMKKSKYSMSREGTVDLKDKSNKESEIFESKTHNKQKKRRKQEERVVQESKKMKGDGVIHRNNPLEEQLNFSNSRFNQNPATLMDSFGFIQSYDKENYNPNVTHHQRALFQEQQKQETEKKRRPIQQNYTARTEEIAQESIQRPATPDTLSSRHKIFNSRKGSYNHHSRNPSGNSNQNWPFAFKHPETRNQPRSYAISSTIQSDRRASYQNKSIKGAKSYARVEDYDDNISQMLDDQFSRMNSLSGQKGEIEDTPTKSMNYAKTQKRKNTRYYSSSNTTPFNLNRTATRLLLHRNTSKQIKIELSKKLRYIGDSLNSLYHGFGRIMTYNGDIIYEGEFDTGLYHGKGKLYNYLRKNKNADQDISTDMVKRYMSLSNANYRRDVRGCRGITSINFEENGWESYDGFFRFGKMDGSGYLVLSDGRKFEGSFKNGLANGYGVLEAYGRKTVGVWEDNVIKTYL